MENEVLNESETKTRLSDDLLPDLNELNNVRSWRGLPVVTREEAVSYAAELLRAGNLDADIPDMVNAHFLPDVTEPETDSKPRPTMKTSILSASLLALALLAGYLLSRGDDALSRAMEARATAARELSAATVAYDAAKTRYGAAKARYEASYRLESCLISLTGAAGSGSCR